MKYAIVIEKAENNYSAYVPDLPGCITTGKSLEETRRLMQEAIEFHIEGLRLHGDPVPQPTSICEYIAKVNRNRRPVEPPRFDLCQASPAKIAGNNA